METITNDANNNDMRVHSANPSSVTQINGASLSQNNLDAVISDQNQLEKLLTNINFKTIESKDCLQVNLLL